MLVLDKAQKMCKIADFSGPQDARVEHGQEENSNLDKYQDLAR